MDKTVQIENFIGVYDNFIMPDDCQKAIDFYERRVKFNETINCSSKMDTVYSIDDF